MPIWRNEALEAHEQERRNQRDALARLAKAAAELANQLNKHLEEAGDVPYGKLPSSPCPTTVLHHSADQLMEDVKLVIEEIMASAARSGNEPLTALFFDCGDYEQANPPGFPATFWRVTVPGSQASLDSETGDLVAANQEPTIHSEEALKAAVQNHLNPYSQEPSCFISVFSDYDRAQNWARTRGPHDKVYITEIDMKNTPSSIHVFDAAWLKQQLNLSSWAMSGEFIFLYRIPQQCLGKRSSLMDIYEQDSRLITFDGKDIGRMNAIAPATLNETTSPQTQSREPFMRYFKAPLEFGFSDGHPIRLLKIENVPIAYHAEAPEKYGKEYAYAVFPPCLKRMISIACCQRTIVNDNSLGDETAEGWWKTISFKSHAFVDNREQAKPGITSLRALFESTKKGVSATLIVAVNLKAKFLDQRQKQLQTPLPDYSPRTIDFEVCRGYITQSSVDIGPVPFIPVGERRFLPNVIYLRRLDLPEVEHGEFSLNDLVDGLAGLRIKTGA